LLIRHVALTGQIHFAYEPSYVLLIIVRSYLQHKNRDNILFNGIDDSVLQTQA